MSTTTPENFNALAGRIIEQVVVDLYEWERDNEAWHDAYCKSRDAHIEIKGCRIRYPSGRTGRFQIYRNQHEKLIENGGYYCFAVYETEALMGEENSVERLRCLPAKEVSEIIPQWNKGAREVRGGREYKISWKKVFETEGEK
jgi:hypothetical protein